MDKQDQKAYQELVDKLYKKVKVVKITKRFEIPEVRSHITGNKTIITNFLQICSTLRRKPEHLAKFMSRELAVQVSIKSERLVLNRKLSSNMINEKLKSYVKEFVICPECGKPDTELIKEGKFMFIHCLACGAKHAVRAKIA